MEYPPVHGGWFVRPFTRFPTPSATLRGPRDPGHVRVAEPPSPFGRSPPPVSCPLASSGGRSPAGLSSPGNARETPHAQRVGARSRPDGGRKALDFAHRSTFSCEEVHEVSRRHAGETPRTALRGRSGPCPRRSNGQCGTGVEGRAQGRPRRGAPPRRERRDEGRTAPVNLPPPPEPAIRPGGSGPARRAPFSRPSRRSSMHPGPTARTGPRTAPPAMSRCR
ncbi:hypothetical protein SFR_2545 [Streptomyces sp. FR-008]|nr:hypothetical protein SFR_2545 [Streptomyces sp. FR-008]